MTDRTDRRVAIISGGSSGMGRATATLLAEQGWDIVLGSRNPQAAAARIAADKGALVIPVAGDLATPQTTGDLIAAARELGRLDGLLLNHGGPPIKSMMEITEAEWLHYFDLMVQGPLRLLRAAVPMFREGGGGRVVAISSFTVKAPYTGIGLSNSLRAALLNALKTAALELGQEGIYINAIGPGYIATERISEWNTSYAEQEGTTPEAIAARTIETVPLRKYGLPEDFAQLAAFLLSARNGYVTGQHILIDGGLVVAN